MMSIRFNTMPVRGPSSRINQFAALFCLLALVVSIQATSWHQSNPLLFMTLGKMASTGQTLYIIRLRSVNPCDLYRSHEAENGTIEAMMYHASRANCLKLVEDAWDSQVKRINNIKAKGPSSGLRKLGISASMSSSSIPKNRNRRGLAKTQFNHISTRDWPRAKPGAEHLKAKIMSLLRTKRSFNDYAEAAVEAAAGTVFGYAGSNFVRTTWNRLDPNSDRNRINRAEENIALENKMIADLKNELNITRLVQDQMLSYLSSLTYTVEEQGAEIKQIAQLTPQLGFQNGFIQQAIIKNSNDLGIVINHYKNHGRVATIELARLLNYTALDDILESDTVMHSVTEENGVITFKFSATTYSETTEVLEVNAMGHYTGLEGEQPMWNTYTGPQYVLYNSELRCAQGLHFKSLPKHIDLTCDQENYMDPELNSWKQEPRDPSSLTISDISVFMDYESHYIYCYPFTIKTDGRIKDCPPWSFDLPNTQSFFIKNRIRWTATKKLADIDQKFSVPLVEQFSQDGGSQFESFSAVNLLKSLAAMRELQRANPVQPMTPLVTTASNYWIQAAVAIIVLLFVVCAFCTFKYLVHLKNYYK